MLMGHRESNPRPSGMYQECLNQLRRRVKKMVVHK
jgi:hypothetical protein